MQTSKIAALTVWSIVELESFLLHGTSRQLTMMRDDGKVDVMMTLIGFWVG
jgi:hypothetical protein